MHESSGVAKLKPAAKVAGERKRTWGPEPMLGIVPTPKEPSPCGGEAGFWQGARPRRRPAGAPPMPLPKIERNADPTENGALSRWNGAT